MRTSVKLWAGLFLALSMTVPARAGEVSVVGHFDNAGVAAEIRTYTDGGMVLGVVALSANGRSIGFVFDRKDWPALLQLWNAARQETGTKYVSFGSLSEVGTSEKCIIAAASGPTVRLTVVSPIDGALVFDLPRYMVSEFDTKLKAAAAATTGS